MTASPVMEMMPAIERYREHLGAGRADDAYEVGWPEGTEDEGLFRRLEDAGAYLLLRELAEPLFLEACRDRGQWNIRKLIVGLFLGRARAWLGELAAARATYLEALEGLDGFGRMQREPSMHLALVSLDLSDVAGFLHWTRFLSKLGSNCENSIPKANTAIGVALVRLRVLMWPAWAELFAWTPWPELWCDAAAARIAVGHFGHTAVRSAMGPSGGLAGTAASA
jgi:hypothetical protein